MRLRQNFLSQKWVPQGQHRVIGNKYIFVWHSCNIYVDDDPLAPHKGLHLKATVVYCHSFKVAPLSTNSIVHSALKSAILVVHASDVRDELFFNAIPFFVVSIKLLTWVKTSGTRNLIKFKVSPLI